MLTQGPSSQGSQARSETREVQKSPTDEIADLIIPAKRKEKVMPTIDEAIKELDAVSILRETVLLPYSLECIRLGIEALKRVKWHKKQHLPSYYELLPGETEE